MFEEDEDEELSAKLFETKSYIRLTDDGEPQLVRVSPVFDEAGVFNPAVVALFIDENEPRIVPRFTVEPMLDATECVPLEMVTHWKHKMIH